ncbi:hypothetical protein PAXINDRAFT_103273, partial [Paxillus involutus ATCC 200175]
MNVDGCLNSTTSNLNVSGPIDQVAMDTSLNSDGLESVSVDVEQVQDVSVEAQPPGGGLHSDDTDASDSESLYTDCHSIPDVDDLARSISGMYMILDLISEQGTGGLVEKVIIAQNSLRDFLNAVSPGTYVSLTKIDFKSLDQLIVKPVGIYGSKEEIVRFLHSIGRIDENLVQELLESSSNPSLLKPKMRSGLYVLRHLRRPGDEELFVIYWPEDTTWDDSASSNVSRNRVTFMRYLTKMCDQLMALISPEHASAIVWSTDEDEYTTRGEDVDGDSRMVTFEVSKTNEQEESVVTRPGFHVPSRFIKTPKVSSDCPLTTSLFKPWLLFGETTQGFITLEYQAAKTISEPIKDTLNALRLGDLLKDADLQINEALDERGLEILLEFELQTRYSDICRQYKNEVEVIKSNVDAQIKSKVSETMERIHGDCGS